MSRPTHGADGPPRGAGPPGEEASGARSGGASTHAAPVASPCTSVCTLDAARRTCVGCLRTIDEIAAWSTLDEDARRAIVASLPSRRAALAGAGGAGGRR